MTDNWKCQDPGVLDALRADTGLPASAKERVLGRLASSVVGLVAESGPPVARIGERLTDVRAEGFSVKRLLAAPLRHPWALALAFVAGTAVGAGGHAWFDRAAARNISHVEQTVRLPVSQATAGEGAALAQPIDKTRPGLEPAVPVVLNASTPRSNGDASASARTPGSSALDAEQALLDRARAALAGGEGAQAMRAIGAHERRFPRSALTEEREALAVKALVAKGSYGEARTRGSRFLQHYPNSIHLSSINDTLATIP